MEKIILLVGRSGSGKTSVQKELEKRGLKSVESYTSRKPRYAGEQGHIFISKEELKKLPNKIAYTEFCNEYYCATSEQIDHANIYVIDLFGIEVFKEKYKGDKQPIIIGLTLSPDKCLERMIQRGDSVIQATNRIEHDKEAFKDIEKKVDYLIDTSYCSVEEIADKIIALL